MQYTVYVKKTTSSCLTITWPGLCVLAGPVVASFDPNHSPDPLGRTLTVVHCERACLAASCYIPRTDALTQTLSLQFPCGFVHLQ